MAALSADGATLPTPARHWRLRDLTAFAGVAIILFLVVFGEMIAPYSAYDFNPPALLQPPSLAHWFGTDEFGRDLFSRVMTGARPAILVALLGAAIGVGIGCLTGLVAGYRRGFVDEAIMRAMDVLMSFPGLVLAMLVVAMLGPNPVNVILALVVVIWPRSARLIRSVVVDLARREFVESARSRGESRSYILFRELLPNILPIVIVDFSLRITSSILLSASLTYLGIGATAPSPTWGLLVKEGQQFMQIAPWLVIFPCAAVVLAAISFVASGERLRLHLFNRTAR